ncbi:hypothetical protein [Pseudomonas sp. P5_C3]
MNSANHHHLADALSAAELMGVGAVRSLDLLRDIDGTIEAISHHCQLLNAAERSFVAVKDSIASGEASKLIPEENVVPVLESLQDSLVKSYAESKAKMQCAINDPRLNDEDGVVDAYAGLLDALTSLNTMAEELRWSILESNADKESDHTPVILSEPADIDKFLDDL